MSKKSQSKYLSFLHWLLELGFNRNELYDLVFHPDNIELIELFCCWNKNIIVDKNYIIRRKQNKELK